MPDIEKKVTISGDSSGLQSALRLAKEESNSLERELGKVGGTADQIAKSFEAMDRHANMDQGNISGGSSMQGSNYSSDIDRFKKEFYSELYGSEFSNSREDVYEKLRSNLRDNLSGGLTDYQERKSDLLIKKSELDPQTRGYREAKSSLMSELGNLESERKIEQMFTNITLRELELRKKHAEELFQLDKKQAMLNVEILERHEKAGTLSELDPDDIIESRIQRQLLDRHASENSGMSTSDRMRGVSATAGKVSTVAESALESAKSGDLSSILRTTGIMSSNILWGMGAVVGGALYGGWELGKRGFEVDKIYKEAENLAGAGNNILPNKNSGSDVASKYGFSKAEYASELTGIARQVGKVQITGDNVRDKQNLQDVIGISQTYSLDKSLPTSLLSLFSDSTEKDFELRKVVSDIDNVLIGEGGDRSTMASYLKRMVEIGENQLQTLDNIGDYEKIFSSLLIGEAIGGKFGDHRFGGKTWSSINTTLAGDGNPYFDALKLDVLNQIHPDKSMWDLQLEKEKGIQDPEFFIKTLLSLGDISSKDEETQNMMKRQIKDAFGLSYSDTENVFKFLQKDGEGIVKDFQDIKERVNSDESLTEEERDKKITNEINKKLAEISGGDGSLLGGSDNLDGGLFGKGQQGVIELKNVYDDFAQGASDLINNAAVLLQNMLDMLGKESEEAPPEKPRNEYTEGETASAMEDDKTTAYWMEMLYHLVESLLDSIPFLNRDKAKEQDSTFIETVKNLGADNKLTEEEISKLLKLKDYDVGALLKKVRHNALTFPNAYKESKEEIEDLTVLLAQHTGDNDQIVSLTGTSFPKIIDRVIRKQEEGIYPKNLKDFIEEDQLDKLFKILDNIPDVKGEEPQGNLLEDHKDKMNIFNGIPDYTEHS